MSRSNVSRAIDNAIAASEEDASPHPKWVRPQPPALPPLHAADLREYLQQIGRFPILTGDEEARLGRRIEVGLLALERLGVHEDTDSAEELACLAQLGQAAKRRFIQSNLKLVVSVAKRYVDRGLPLMELIQHGNVGLVRAIDRYDYRSGARFPAAASWWIRQAIEAGLAETTVAAGDGSAAVTDLVDGIPAAHAVELVTAALRSAGT